jgi:mRNA-degrading endonuclease RelE of RelBE toxin-antitoxin system
MIFERKPSFDRRWKSLSPERSKQTQEALHKLVLFFEGGPKPEGLGLKKLRGDFWEIRTNLKDRIFFQVKKGTVSFILIGNHNEIHRLLKRV